MKLAEGVKSIRLSPVNLKAGDEYLFQHEYSKNIASIEMLTQKNLLVSGYGIILSHTNTKLSERFTRAVTIKYLKRLNYCWLWVKILLSGKLDVFNSALFVIEPGNSGYFHWVTETVPRLLASGERFKASSVLLPVHYKAYRYMQESLVLLGFNTLYIPEERFALIKANYFITPFATAGNYNDEIINKTRVAFTHGQLNKQPHRLIYISRTKSDKRKITNEEELLPILHSYGFETVYCETLTLKEQVELFFETKVLIGNHGAGLTNMLFMQKKTAVLELRYAGDANNNCYFSLASALSIHYFYQSCKPITKNENPHQANVIVDLETLSDNLQLIAADS